MYLLCLCWSVPLGALCDISNQSTRKIHKSLDPYKGHISKQINKLRVAKSHNQSRNQEKNVVRQNLKSGGE